MEADPDLAREICTAEQRIGQRLGKNREAHARILRAISNAMSTSSFSLWLVSDMALCLERFLSPDQQPRLGHRTRAWSDRPCWADAPYTYLVRWACQRLRLDLFSRRAGCRSSAATPRQPGVGTGLKSGGGISEHLIWGARLVLFRPGSKHAMVSSDPDSCKYAAGKPSGALCKSCRSPRFLLSGEFQIGIDPEGNHTTDG